MTEPLKNMFNQRFFEALIEAFREQYSAFKQQAFLDHIDDGQWEQRELKDRMRHITIGLRHQLPSDYRLALEIVRKTAPELSDFSFETMIFPDFVEVYGLEDWDVSLPALEQFTQQSSAEFAVRPFILHDQQPMMKHMLVWARHESYHVRRLASEGCRPRLPWAIALPAFKADPSPILPILEHLKLDESEYVRRSVANNLNDIAKDNPQVVIDTLRRWKAHNTPDMQQLINRALRTLVKQGNPDALALLGYDSKGKITIQNLSVHPQTIPMGGEVTISFTVESHSDEPQPALIDYIVHHQRANGQQTPKVFKLTKTTLTAHEKRDISKKHNFRAITTRKYYAGDHAVEIQVNGLSAGRVTFVMA
jgi:3-methyladenine DNA glycosylase AlkC